ncbi:MAG: RNA-binding S4 domain-containing protein [Gammaproteobacteria bacterium]
MENDGAIRIDRWLHATRWFKSRSLAVDAIANGRIEVNGLRAKPSRLVRIGDTIVIRRPPRRYELVVHGLSARRLAASLAQTLYAETASSIAARTALDEALALSAVGEHHHGGKLDKRDRRERERLKRRQA